MRKNLLLSVFFLALTQFTTLAQPGLPTGLASANFHLYVLAGQSNMAGRGTVETVDKTPHPRVGC
ncbi:MAG TPA: sialate O-acetylesterase [Fibrella sp.]